MHKIWFKLCSFLLVIVMLANMLPLQSYAEQLSAGEMGQISTGTDLAEKDASPGQIVDELAHKRTEYTKQFRMDNGLFIAAVYSEPVHYEKDGQWVEIDNTLTAQLNGTYTNTAGVWNVSFPNQLTADNRISVTKDTYTLSFGMAGELRTSGDLEIMSAGETAAPAAAEVLSPSDLIEGATAETFAVTQAQTSTAQLETVDIAAMKAEAEHPEMVAEKLYSGLQYNNVYGTTDIRYNLNSNTVKESIILESYSSTLRGYRYTLEVGDLNPVLQDDGSIHFYDAENKEIVMVMEAPFLVDDALEYNFDVQVRLTGSGSTYTLTYLLPTSWLASSDRAWPVVLDPVIKPTLSTSNIRDRCIASRTSYSYTDGVIQCGYTIGGGIHRFFIKYRDLPELTSSDVITDATITLYKPQTSTATTIVQVHKVLNTWESDTMTWSSMSESYNPSIEDFLSVRASGKYTWNVTDIARSWYEDENKGMMFRANEAVETGGVFQWSQFYSSDYSNTGDSLPSLEITFRNNNGLESDWNYISSSAGRAGTGSVNSYTGNLVWVRDDIGFAGNRMPVSICHVYNANDALAANDSNNSNDTAGNAFGMGNGWRTNFNELVYHWETDSTTVGDYYVWEDSDGTDHYFEYQSSGVYVHEEEDTTSLTTTGSGDQKYCWTDKNGNIRYFDTYGRLTKIQNNQATPSSITITYSGDTKKISTIADGAGRKYNFIYNDSGLLTRISYIGNGTTEISYVTFEYESFHNNLISINDKDEKTCLYEYSNSLDGFDSNTQNPNLLISATDIDGYKLTYTYNTLVTGNPARISSITETHNNAEGGQLTITYQHNQTTIVDKNDNKQIMQFDNKGNSTCIQDGEGRAQYAEFVKDDSGETAKGNQLALASKLQYTVASIAKDSSFENDTLWSLEPSDAAASRSISSTTYYGSKSMCLTATDAADLLGTTFAVSAGESYTFSAYVKVSSGSARLALRNTADASDTEYSEALTSDTWTRLEVCYTNGGTGSVTVAPTLSAAAGTTVYMDCVQVEKAPTASRYNLIENGDFRYSLDTWTKTGCTTADTVALQTKTVDGVEREDPAAPQLDANAFEITGSPTAQKRLTQTVNISGAADDSFVFAGWAKGNAARLGEIQGNTREFAVQMRFNYTDGSSSNPFAAQFNPDSNEWQYVAAVAIAAQAYSSITIQLVYDYNVNTVCFDGIQLYKEEFGISYTYDKEGNVTSVTDLQKQVTEYEYDTDSKLTAIIQDNKAKMTYTYYENSKNVKTATSAEGQVYYFEYDQWGNTKLVSIGSGDTKITSTAVFSDDGNRLVSTTDALGKVTTYSYNADTNMLEWVKYPEDTDATKTTYTYDEMYRMATAAVTTNTNLSLSATYTYDNDLLTKLQTASTTYDFSYGDFALRSSVKIGERTLASYTYTDDGNYYLSSLDYGNGDSVEHEYDGLGRVTRQTYEDGDEVTYQYDNSGALATVEDSATGRKTTYYYDLTDRMVKYVETGTNYHHSVGYEYNAENNLTSLVENINGTDYTTSYVYDDDNRLTSMTTNGTTVEYTYDDYGRVTTQVTKRGDITILTETFTYVGTNAGTSSQIAAYKTETANYSVTYSYTYDDNGNILSVSDGTNQTNYIYDSANQLRREDNEELGFTHAWTYDNAGNIRTRAEYSHTTGSLVSATRTDTVPYTYGNSEWGDLLTAYDGKVITYDTIGNPLNDGARTYIWEHGRELARLTQNGVVWNYAYDSNGMRTRRVSGAKNYNYIYSGSKLMQMSVGGYTVNFTYDASGTPLTITFNGVTFYYVTNIQGDVVGILSPSGVEVVRYRYDAWGNILSTDGSMAATLGVTNPLRYRGYVYDQETELYYLQSRYYDPTLGRFLNADVLFSTKKAGMGCNIFTYCFNNPSNYIDTAGTDAIWIHEDDSAGTFGHGGLLVQGEDNDGDGVGEWYFFYWGPVSENATNREIALMSTVGITSDCVLVEVEIGDANLQTIEGVVEVLNNTGDPFLQHRASMTTDIVYLQGDYTATYNHLVTVQTTKGGKWNYHLTLNNCAQVSWLALRQSDSRFISKCPIIPDIAFYKVQSLSKFEESDRHRRWLRI